MTSEEHNAINQAAAHKLKAIIDSSYPLKQFVAIAGGQIVADDGDFDKLQAKLAALGFDSDPLSVLVDQAGVDTLSELFIL